MGENIYTYNTHNRCPSIFSSNLNNLISLFGSYVCITPASPGNDIVLTYPNSDPSGLLECLGFVDSNRIVGRREDGPATCPPRGRSFHNTRFVHQLRLAALRESNVTVYCGRGHALIREGDERDTAPYSGQTRPLAFVGFDENNQPLPHAELPCSSNVPARRSVAISNRAGPTKDAAVVGVAWIDERGTEQVSRAPLSIVCDGMYSMLRSTLTQAKSQTVSHIVGLLLQHPRGVTSVLPYPGRGHVILADPSPVLLYQISSKETRILIDVPGDLPSVMDGSLQR
jgi:hypothetical protein